MSGPARQSFPGRPDQVARARAFVRASVGEACPVVDDAELMASELCANAVRHSASGRGGSFEVTVTRRWSSLRVEVRDGGARDGPKVPDFDELAEGGRGLVIVELLAARWGQSSDEFGRSVFFELRWQYPMRSPDAGPAGVSRFAHPIQRPLRERQGQPGGRNAAPGRQAAAACSSVVIDGERLRQLRGKQGMSQEKLMRAAGVSLATVSRLERERRAACLGRTVARLASALGEDPEALLASAESDGPVADRAV